MSDRLIDAFEALERVDVPISWDDVTALDGDALDADAADLPDMATVGELRSSHRRLAAIGAAAAALVVAVVIVAVRADTKPDHTGVSVPSTVPTTQATPTTQAATSSFRVFPVTAWTGDLYLVWSGEAGQDTSIRADGWAYNPTTGETTDIPTAPIAPRTEAVGVWTGEELIVCCGAGYSDGGPEYDTDTAAAYRPDTGTWRRLADPPDDAAGGWAAAVWTGDRMIVTLGSGAGSHVVAYDPTADRWSRLADPPASLGRIPEAVWTGREVIVWTREDYAPSTTDRGLSYNPTTDTWAALPDLPAGSVTNWGSIAWTGDEVVVYGSSAADESRVAGARWRPGDKSWRAVSDPGLGPVSWYDGTPGSQSIAWDDVAKRLVVWPVNGGEASSPLLTYNPSTDKWFRYPAQRLGYHPQLEIGDGVLLHPDRDNPVVARLYVRTDFSG
jgi:hypothetical protein